MVALVVILFPPMLIAFLLVMERVEEPLRRPNRRREVAESVGTTTAAEFEALGSPGARRARGRWRRRRVKRAAPPLV